MICKLKNLRIFCKRLKMDTHKKWCKAGKTESPHVLNTVFNTWGKIFRKKELSQRDGCDSSTKIMSYTDQKFILFLIIRDRQISCTSEAHCYL